MRNQIQTYLILFLTGLISLTTTYGATFIVDNLGDVDDLGPAAATTNTLRKCIRLANANPGVDNINFNILGVGPFVINRVTNVDITGPVIIDGFTQPGAVVGAPLIEITFIGNNALTLVNGSAGSTITGLVVYGGNRGIYIIDSDNNTIRGNFVGTNRTGTAIGTPIINWNGIQIENSQNTTIGGLGGAADRNIISGINEAGVHISTSSAGTKIYGNYIGTGINGTTAIPNVQRGISLLSGSDNTEIGGATAAHRNIISGNAQRGINVNESDDVIIQNNYIGTDATGNGALGNTEQGIVIENLSLRATISNNIIGSNGQQGVSINGSNYPIIKGNRIGLGLNGTTQLGNGQQGLNFENVFKPIIGGTTLTERNYVSNNRNIGIRLFNADSVVIKGNYIGLNEAGDTDYGNTEHGIWMNGSDNPIIGGGEAGARNIISGNNQMGLFMELSINPTIIDNYIGTNSTGSAAIGNGGQGVFLINQCNSPTITNNVISANLLGLQIINSTAPFINNNKVGVDVGGTIALGNLQRGVVLENYCHNPVITNNVISSNRETGLQVSKSINPLINNNKVGTDITGMIVLGNGQRGIAVTDSCHDPIITNNIASNNGQIGIVVETSFRPRIQSNIIGLASDELTAMGNTQVGLRVFNSREAQIGGLLTSERNYMSNNGQIGIYVERSNASKIQGNYVGTNQTGVALMGNKTHGIEVTGSDSVLIGGTGGRNIVVNNNEYGIMVNNSKYTKTQSNYVGVGSDGGTTNAPLLGNGIGGISVRANSDFNLVGGSLATERNIVSYNGHRVEADGIHILTSKRVTVIGNYCGTDATGTLDRGNLWAGISVNGSDSITIGGPGAFEANICSGNHHEGIYLSGSTNTTIVNNLIGTDVNGTSPIGNDGYGVRLGENSANSNNVIGGSLASANTIAFTIGTYSDTPNDVATIGGPGVFIDQKSHRSEITFNKIFCNAGLGIEVEGVGNENIANPTIIETDINTAIGTGTPGYIIHAYVNNATMTGGSGCGCEGETYLGTTTVLANGTWSFNHGLNFVNGDTRSITVTQTNLSTPKPSTSEFACLVIPPCDIVLNNEPVDSTTCRGNNALFNLAATGTSIVYRWQQLDATNTFVDIANTNNDTLNITTDLTFTDTTYYRAILSNSYFCGDTTATVGLFLLPNTVITLQPHDTTICTGESLTLTTTATGSNISYQWKHNGINTGTNSDTYTIPSIAISDSGSYYVEITSDCGVLNSDTIQVDVSITPSADLAVSDTTLCPTIDVGITVTNAQLGVRYQAFMGATSVSTIQNGTNGNLRFVIAHTLLSVGVNKVAIRAYGCFDTTLVDTAIVTVLPTTQITLQPTGLNLCIGDNLTLTSGATGSNVVYQWKKNNTAIAGASSDNFIRPIAALADSGMYFNTITGDCGTLNTDTISVSVKGDPSETLAVSDIDICKGGNATITVSNSQLGVRYEAYRSGSSVSAIQNGTGSNLNFTINAASLIDGLNRISIRAFGCHDTTLLDTARIVVLAPPTQVYGPTQVCDNAVTGLIYSTDSVAGAFDNVWTITNGTITTTSTSTDSITVDLPLSPSTITVTPRTASGHTCTSAKNTVTQLAGYPGNEILTISEDTVCVNNTIDFKIATPSANLGYVWTLPAGASVVNYNSDKTSATILFAETGPKTVSVQPSHTCTTGSIAPLTSTVEIIAQPIAFAGADVVSDKFDNILLDGTGSSEGNLYSYEWTTTSTSSIDQPYSLTTTVSPKYKFTEYVLTVSTTNTASCESKDLVTVTIPFILPEIPNIFSPNNDLIHDVLVIKNIEYTPSAVIYIYNQWGELIYKSEPGYPTPWDGKRNGIDVPISAYYYVFEVNESDAEPFSGHITIVR